MNVNNIILKNFRNYEDEKIEFSPFVNVIYGDNAQGKTNILEGIYLFSMGKSNRTYHDSELIRFGFDEARLKMSFFGQNREKEAEMIIRKNNRKSVFFNEIPVKRNSDLVGKFNVVYFGPDTMNIIKSGPLARRKSLDITISQLKASYFGALGEYKKAIEAKSAILKSEKKDRITLEILNEKIIDLSLKIIKDRFFYIKKIEEKAREIQNDISKGEEKLQIKYQSAAGLIEEFDENEIRKRLIEKQEKNIKREIDFCEISFGVHRDDIEYFINEKNVRSFGSQGQQKTVALVQKTAEVNLIFEEKGEFPVLLLDDIMSELDLLRQEYILTQIKNMQIIITCTDKEKFKILPQTKEIKIEKGKVL